MLDSKNETRKEIITATAQLLADRLFDATTEESINTIESSKIPLPGHYWEGNGGIYVGIVRDDDRYWHLILAVDPMAIFKGEWGAEDVDISDCSSLVDGLANTQSMVKSGHDHPTLKQLAEFNKTGQDGHTDFYLPAQKENDLIWINAANHIENISHWSSTQYSADYAWSQYFSNGRTNICCKDDELAARAVRRLVIQ